METLPEFRLLRPASIAEALSARASEPRARFMAGGTDLVPALRRGIGEPAALIDLSGIAALGGIALDQSGLRIGAGVTLAALVAHPDLRRDHAVIAAAAASVAAPAHREAATLGGNLCLDTRCVFYNQSQWWRRANAFCMKHEGDTCHVAPMGRRCHAAYSGDLAPALLVLDASVEIAGAGGTRRLPLADLYEEDGAAHLRLGGDELLTAIHVPPPGALVADYAKARQRGAIDFPLAGVAVALRREGDRLAELRVALTGTNSRPFLLARTKPLTGAPLDDEALKRLDQLVQKQVSPMRTTIAPAHYRRRVAAALTRRLATQLWERAAAPRVPPG